MAASAIVSTAGDDARRRPRGTRGAVLLALGGFVAVRALVLAWLFLTAHEIGQSGFRLLTRWDAQWYAGIAAHGYGAVQYEDGRVLTSYAFFPLYPWTERLVAGLTGLSPLGAGVLISAVAGLVAAAAIFAVADDVLGRRAAVIATVLWAALPIGVVQSMAYTESLFTALVAWSLFLVLRKHWLPAALLACAAGLARPSGAAVVLAVMVPAAVSLAADVRRAGALRPRALLDRRLTSMILAPLGLLGYLGWVGRLQHTPLGYFKVADGWNNDFDGGVAFARWIGAQLVGPAPMTGVLLLLALGALAYLVVACFRQRQPLPLLVFTVVIVVMALTTSAFFGSKPRYLLPAFPLLFPPARWLAGRRTVTVAVLLVALAVVEIAYSPVWTHSSGPP